MNIEKTLKHLKFGKIVGKVLIGISVLLFLGGFAVMYFMSYRHAEGLYTASLVLLILGLVTYFFLEYIFLTYGLRTKKIFQTSRKGKRG